MNIEGLSEATIEKFIEMGFVDKYPDIFEIEKYHDEITELDGFGEKSFDKLIKAIEKSKTVNLCNFIYALGINHVGLSNAKLLCKYFNNDLDKIMSAKADELVNIEGFGEIIALAIERYFGYEENRELIERALKFVTFVKEEITSDGVLSGKTFVITGDLNRYKNRKVLQAVIESLGGKVAGSVSSKTSFLINNDINSASSKNKKAKEVGVPIITEEDFVNNFL
jgi:DNA ligase (NAD+)